MKRTYFLAAFAAVVGLTASLSAVAASSATMRVIVVQTADVPAYVHEVHTLQAIFKKLGQPVTLRVWQATYAGSDTNSIIVSVEYPNFMTLAKVNDMFATNQEVVAEMNKIGAMRKILSDSLYQEQAE
jgi:CTP:molybdopterin cytidylyltransferase MocA